MRKRLFSLFLFIVLVFTTTISPVNVIANSPQSLQKNQHDSLNLVLNESNNLIINAVSVTEGTYYLNNKYCGQYLYNNNNSLAATSGLIATYSSNIRWMIGQYNGYYTLRAVNTTLYLKDTSASPTLGSIGGFPTNEFLWEFTIASGGGYILRNIGTSKYLYTYGSSLYSSTTIGTAGTSQYYTRTWRLAESTSYYGNTSYYTYRELMSGFGFNISYIFVNDSISPAVKKYPTNSIWADISDFNYSGYNSSLISINSLTGIITCVTTSASLQSTTVTATHKVTGLTTTFDVIINPRACLVGVTNEGHDHSTCLTNIQSNLLNCRYSSATLNTGAFTAATITSYLDANNNNVFVSRSHGGLVTSGGVQIGTCILLNDDSANSVFLTSSGISSQLDLTNMKLIMFIACETGVGGAGGLNLPSAVVDRGAKTAVGFTDNIDCITANAWTIDFFALMEQGVSVSTACANLALSDEYKPTSMKSYMISGYFYTLLN